MIDDYHISYLSTGRDILRLDVSSATRPNSPIIMADPDFDLESQSTADLTESSERYPHLLRDLRSHPLTFERLPGTRAEARQIGVNLGVRPLLATEALESSLKACQSPCVLHLATHGFFLADHVRDPNEDEERLIIQQETTGQAAARLLGQRLDNPLLRSGLALAGANTWLRHQTLPQEAEDGLLTAEDVSGLDLTNTDLVVLSACETGLGHIHMGEGVFGLRRAFVLAGAKTLVMSLWKVPDEQTQTLMIEFYRRLRGGQPRCDALRDAQLVLKEKYPHPFYWGAFICQGNPRPLPEHRFR